jgi:hypothetical protein
MPRDEDVFPVIAYADGAISEDGRAVLLKMETIEHGPVHCGMKVGDVHDFVTFLLRLVTHRQVGNRPARRPHQPIPVTGVSAGELEDGNGCLGLTIGGDELLFEMPTSALSEIGRTLMAASAPKTQRSA